jgi:hypothetical protein
MVVFAPFFSWSRIFWFLVIRRCQFCCVAVGVVYFSWISLSSELLEYCALSAIWRRKLELTPWFVV